MFRGEAEMRMESNSTWPPRHIKRQLLGDLFPWDDQGNHSPPIPLSDSARISDPQDCIPCPVPQQSNLSSSWPPALFSASRAGQARPVARLQVLHLENWKLKFEKFHLFKAMDIHTRNGYAYFPIILIWITKWSRRFFNNASRISRLFEHW